MIQVQNGEFRFPLISSVVFGTGSVQRIGEKVDEFGARRALIVTVPPLVTETNLVERVRSTLGGRCAGVFSGVVQHVPRQCVFEGGRLARELDADIVISLGGSSTADAAKGIRLVLAEGEQLDDFPVRLDGPDSIVVPELKKPKLPQIAIPTTLSAGEFTDSTGITDMKRKHKDVFRDPKLTPKVIILDPEVTVFTGRELWASTGLKVLSDCFEEICSPRHQPFVDALALHAIQIINRHLVPSITEPLDLGARAMLQHAAWMSIHGMRATGLGIVAALRHQIGATYDVAHGVASTIVFPYCINFNRPLVNERLALVARALDLPIRDASDAAGAAINRVKELISEIGLPSRLRDVGVPREGLKVIAEASMQDYAIRNNPKPVNSKEQLLGVLEQAW